MTSGDQRPFGQSGTAAGSTGSRVVGPFRAALFDMDGTLIDSAGNGERAWHTLAERWQLAAPDQELFREIHGMPARQALARMLPASLVDAACRDLEALEVVDTVGVVALPGAAQLLSAIPDQLEAIVTSSFRTVARARLSAAGITPPQHMVTCELITRGKPDPEPFIEGARLLGVAPSSAVVFEDTWPGIRSALAAGCTVIAVEGLHRRDELAEADLVVHSLLDIRVLGHGPSSFELEVREA